jgi:hypothetical protein
MASAWLKVLGLGDSSGVYLYHTGSTPPSGVTYGTALPYLLTVPTSMGQRLDPLATVGSDAAVTVDLLIAPVGASIASELLVRGQGTPAQSGGSTVRVAAYHSAADTTLTVTDTSGISAGTLLWLASTGECLKVSAVTSATTLSVGRGQLETVARPISAGGVFAAAAWDSYPGPHGMIAEMGVDSETLWRGVVDSVAVTDGTRCSVTMHSLTSVLRRIPYDPPRALQPVAHADLTLAGAQLLNREMTVGPIIVDADAYGSSGSAEWSHALLRVGGGDEWCIVQVSQLRTYTEGGRQLVEYETQIQSNGSGVVAIGEGATVVEFAEQRDRLRAALRILRRGCTVEWAGVQTAPDAELVLQQWLTRAEPVGTGLALPLAWLDLSAIGDGTQIGSVPALAEVTQLPLTGDPIAIVAPADSSRTVLEVAESYLLRPAALGLSTGRTGQLTAVDWGWDTITATALTGDDTASASYSMQARATDAVPLVVLERQTELRSPLMLEVSESVGMHEVSGTVRIGTTSTQDLRVVASDRLGPQSGLEPRRVRVYANRRTLDEVELRTIDVVSLYSRSLPILRMQLRSALVSVGDRLTVQRADLMQADGTRGSSLLACIVLEQSTDTGSGVQSVALLVLDWYAGAWSRALWAPAAEVTIYGTGSAGVQPNAYTDSSAPAGSGYPTSDADAFAAAIAGAGGPIVVDICDPDGTRQGTAECSAAASNTLTLSSVTHTPTAGDLIVMAAPADQLTTAASTWMLDRLALLGDSSGQVSSTDVPRWG